MATVLFINRTDLVRNSIMDGNVDTDKFIQFIKLAQEIHIQNYLGTQMYDGLTAALVAGIDLPANARWKTLLNDYVVPMLIWFSQVDYIPFASYQIRNGGMYKHRSENSETISLEEMNMMLNKVTETAEFYTRRFVDYMGFYSQLFPEYNQSTNGEMYPDKDVNFHSWVL